MAAVNLALRFLLELAGVAGIGYAAFQLTSGPVRWIAAVAAVAALVITWALVVAPNATNGLTPVFRELVGSVLLLAVAALLALAGRSGFAAAFAVLVVVNTVLLEWLGNPELVI